MKLFILSMLTLNISLLLITNLLDASLKIDIDKNYTNLSTLNKTYEEMADTAVTKQERGSIFYPFNPFVAIPVSILSGFAFAGVFAAIISEDKSDPLWGVAEMEQATIGFLFGFTGSMVAFVIMAYKKGKEKDEKKSTSSFDLSISSHSLPIKTQLYFLNYKYHF